MTNLDSLLQHVALALEYDHPSLADLRLQHECQAEARLRCPIAWPYTSNDRISAHWVAEDTTTRSIVIRPTWAGYMIKVSGSNPARREEIENEIRTHLDKEIES